MIGVALAALSAASYGAADFSGAVASNDNESTLVTVLMQVVSLVSLFAVVILFSEIGFRDIVFIRSDLIWGSVAGLGAALGLATFYKALAIGPMATAASLTAMWGAAIPVGAGLLLGDRPGTLTMIGIGVAIPASILVSIGGLAGLVSPTNTTPRERITGLSGQSNTRALSVIAGIGFGVFFIALSRTSGESGLTPLFGARAASIAALSIVITGTRAWAPVKRRWWPTILIAGVLDCAANAFYLVALDYGSFTWIAAIGSLYPLATVFLARLLLKERLAPIQIVGFGLAGLALAMVALGATAA